MKAARFSNLRLFVPLMLGYLCIVCIARSHAANEKLTLEIQTGHTYPIRSLAFSPDGHIVATGGNDDRIILWQTESGHQLRTLAGQEAQVLSIAFSPDGRT